MRGFDPDVSLDNVAWSLVHEMRLSLLFPLVFVLVTRWPRSMALAALGGTVALSLGVRRFGLSVPAFLGTNGAESLIATAHFLPMFVFGAALAVRREPSDAGCARQAPAGDPCCGWPRSGSWP